MQTFEYALTIGTILDNRYKIESILGEGGFGITYKAHDQDLDYTVVIKEFLPQEFAARANDTVTVQARTNRTDDYEYGLTSFIEEARTLAKFQHPNIVRVSNFLKANGTAYFVMDYAQGIALDEWLKSQPGALSEESILNIITPILKGLSEVHKNDFLHRDIKPGNIFLRKKDGPMLIDFGAARMALGEHSKSISAIISMGYAPPEQYTSRGKQGPYTDLYAVGAVLYKLITGNTPIESPDRSHAKAEDEADPLMPALEAGKAKVSDWLLKICDQLLSVSPKQRPQSAEAVLVAIENKEMVDLKEKTVTESEENTGTRVVTDDKRFDDERSASIKKVQTLTASKNSKKVLQIATGAVLIGVVIAAVVTYLNRTFVLEIDSMPQGASISLNGKELKLTTPAKIVDVVPGPHVVRLNKSGYDGKHVDIAVNEDSKILEGLTEYHRLIIKADKTEHVKAKQGEVLECIYPDAIDYQAPGWVCEDSVAGLIVQSVGSGKYIEPVSGIDKVIKKDKVYRNYLSGPMKAYQQAIVGLEKQMQVEVGKLVRKYVEDSGASAEQADTVLSGLNKSISTFKSKSGKVSYQGMIKTYTETSGEGKNQVVDTTNVMTERLTFNAGKEACRMMFKNYVSVEGQRKDTKIDRVEEYVAKDGDKDISGCEFSVVVKDLDDSGYKLVDMVKSPAGTYFALVGFTEDGANSKTKKTLKDSMENEKALWKQFKDKKAQQELADEIANQ